MQSKEHWITLIPIDELPIGTRKIFNINNINIALLNIDNEIFAIEDNCPHHDLPLGEKGDIDLKNKIITCPFHGAQFCLRSGEVKSPPAFSNLNIFKSRIFNNHIEINLP